MSDELLLLERISNLSPLMSYSQLKQLEEPLIPGISGIASSPLDLASNIFGPKSHLKRRLMGRIQGIGISEEAEAHVLDYAVLFSQALGGGSDYPLLEQLTRMYGSLEKIFIGKVIAELLYWIGEIDIDDLEQFLQSISTYRGLPSVAANVLAEELNRDAMNTLVANSNYMYIEDGRILHSEWQQMRPSSSPETGGDQRTTPAMVRSFYMNVLQSNRKFRPSHLMSIAVESKNRSNVSMSFFGHLDTYIVPLIALRKRGMVRIIHGNWPEVFSVEYVPLRTKKRRKHKRKKRP
jgi:hypothetical protein